MVDVSEAVRRSALGGRSAIMGERIGIAPLPPMARFVLRIDEAAAVEVGAVAGFQIDGPLLRGHRRNNRLAARLGPNEWLLLAPDGETGEVVQEIEAGMVGRFHALVDVGHRNVGIEVSGPEAAAVLNAGCPIDLTDEAFPIGAATRTILGKAEIVLIRTHPERYHVECWRSFATYVFDFLCEASLDVSPAAATV